MPTERNTFLLADDYPSFLRSTAMIIRPLLRENQTIVTAANGDEALAVIARMSDQIFAVLTDLDMPGVSGDGVAQAALDAKIPHIGIYTVNPRKVTIEGIRVLNKLAGTFHSEIGNFISEAVAKE